MEQEFLLPVDKIHSCPRDVILETLFCCRHICVMLEVGGQAAPITRAGLEDTCQLHTYT